MALIDIIAGARPNFMKVAPIIHELQKQQSEGVNVQFRLVHTGQHFSANMSAQFFTDLNIPEPDVNLESEGNSQATQAASIMTRYEHLLASGRSDLCLVVGDVTSTMACAITAKKMGIPVAHVEAGIRSGDWAMPEEVNRVVTDSITDWFYTTTPAASNTLIESGVQKNRIRFVGNVMIDTLLANETRFCEPPVLQETPLNENGYFVLTLHRPSNVDEKNTLENLINCIGGALGEQHIVFPVHPRTEKYLDRKALLAKGIHCIDPMGYLEFMYLIKHAKGVITDSGGITEETTVMGIPCVTLRDSTERPETITIGTNELAGTTLSDIKRYVEKLASGDWKKGAIPEKWDGRSAQRIVKHLIEVLV